MKSMLNRSLRATSERLLPFAREARCIIRAQYCKLAYRTREHFRCPICGYFGPFDDYADARQTIRNTLCPRCDLYERHRLQYLVIDELAREHDFSKMSLLHFAPEPSFQKPLRSRFASYHTADIAAHGVDFRVDIRALPFDSATYDIVLASHVLEHVREDDQAMLEVRRILRPGGMALLPVPVVSPQTIEYPEPNPHEFGHVRAIGLDYFDKYRKVFDSVRVFTSADFAESHQLYTYEDRACYPKAQSPHRKPMPGERHPDYVPVCYR